MNNNVELSSSSINNMKFNKSFKFRGRNYTYSGNTTKQLLTNRNKLLTKLKIPKDNWNTVTAGKVPQKIIYDKSTKRTLTYDPKKPLLLKKFTTKDNLQRISNENLLKTNFENNDIKIFDKLPSNLPRKVGIVFTAKIQISQDIKTKTFTFTTTLKKSESVKTAAEEYLDNYYGTAAPDYQILNMSDFKVYENNTQGKQLTLSNMTLRLSKPPVLKMFDNIDTTKNYNHCVKDYLKDLYGKRYVSRNFNNINNVDDIYNFCKSKQIKMMAYDINGTIIKAYYPVKRNKTKTCIFLAYHNHLYPLKSSVLSKVKPLKINDNEIVLDRNEFDEKFLSIIKQGTIPNGIKCTKDEIRKFDYNDNIYICNKEYLECKKILKKFGLYDRIFPGISFSSVAKFLQDLYIKENVNSFLPEDDKFKKGGYSYCNFDIVKKDDKLITVDANKFYPSCLKDLEYIYSVDILLNEVEYNFSKEIQEDYLYLVKPDQHSILLPNTNLYTGEYLLKCQREGLNFELLERIRMKQFDNYYKALIQDLYKKVDNTIFKKIMVQLIGSFEMSGNYEQTKFLKLCNEDEKKRSDGYFKKLDDDLFLNFDYFDSHVIDNKKVIAIQIKDQARYKLYQKMIQLKINESNLVKINTDSITYIGTKEPKTTKIMGGWKIENKEVEKINVVYFDNPNLSFTPNDIYQNKLVEAYAGCGKTYHIKHNVLPSLEDYIILTPSHSSLKEYKQDNLNCRVIQTYQYNPNLEVKEKNIIIDEVGMLNYSHMKLLYRWALQGKYIQAYGDFKQLLSVTSDLMYRTQYNKPLFINKLFGEKDTMTTNRRNNFTKDFYDDCINGNVDKKELRQKYLNNEDSLNVCCYSNLECDKHNKRISKKLGYNDIFKVGAKVICNTNKLAKYNIYNKFTFKVTNVDDEFIELDNEYKIPRKECLRKEGKKDFISFGYARTLYSYQGESINDLYFPEEELKYIDDRGFYTLISRIKQ